MAPRPMSPLQRFWPKVRRQPDGCWLWTACRDDDGYGILLVNGRTMRAHRFAFSEFIGPIAEGLAVHHLCSSKACVNPDHLALVTPSEHNLLPGHPAAIQRDKTHCRHGHPFSGENLAFGKNGQRVCRECNRQKALRWIARNPERHRERSRESMRRMKERQRQ